LLSFAFQSNNRVVDSLDRAIIDELQRDGRLTNQELASRVGLTPAPCLRRVRRLEADGVITGYVATVDPSALGRSFEVLINADLVAKDLATVERFEARIAAMAEVVELRRMFGLPDYLIRVQVEDLAAYERWLTTQLMGDAAIARVDSRLTMKLVKTLPGHL
jgi:DNA-binding Lrp family transcriptional regulator